MPFLLPHRGRWPALAATLGLGLLLAMPGLRGDDFAVVSARLRSDLLGSLPTAAAVSEQLASLSASGTWSDINYASTEATTWAPRTHLARLLDMAKAYTAPGHSLAGSTTLRDGILRAYDAWTARDPRSSNWYHNEIGTPQNLARTILLVESELGATRVSSGLSIVSRATRARSITGGTNTGANRIDRAYASLIRGLVSRDATLTGESFLAVGDTLVTTTSEGIQVDGSFHQHGPQLHNGSYGMTFSKVSAEMAGYAAGTGYQLPAAQIGTLVDMFLDGHQWLSRGRTFDWTSMGRTIARPEGRGAAGGMVSMLDDLLLVAGSRRDELSALRARVADARATGVAKPELAAEGSRHFWRSDITAHQRRGYYASVKTSSPRTLQPEMGNGEGLQSLHLADGVNLVMRRGNEYDAIFPVWDWRRLPGTTTEQSAYSLAPSGAWGVAGTSPIAGGVSDGMYSLAVFDHARLNVAARKSWFFFDDEYVALGAGIDAPAATGDVITTINQVHRVGGVTWGTAGGGPEALSTGSLTRSDLAWVAHDSIGYVFPEPAQVTVRAVSQSGSWRAINETQSAATISADVFSLQVDHGQRPAGGRYAYIVVPDATPAETAAYAAARPPVRILANERQLQAVRHEGLGLTQAAFHAPGQLRLDDGLSVRVDRPAALMLSETGDGGLRLAAADPTAGAATLRLDVRREAAGEAADFARITMRLPQGELAGATVARDLPAPVRPLYAVSLREAAAGVGGLLHQWSFEGSGEAALADSRGTAPLRPLAYGTQGDTTAIAFGGGAGIGSTAFAPQRLGRTPSSAGGAALVTTGTVSLPTSFTVEAVVRPDLLEADGRLGYAVMSGGWSDNRRGYFLAQQEGGRDALATIVGDHLTEPDNARTLVDAFEPGHWYYVATTYDTRDGQTTVNAYVANLTRGQTAASRVVTNGTASGTPPTSAPFGIGGLYTNGILQEAWSGTIDEVAVFGRTLAPSEVQARLTTLYAPPARLTWSGNGTTVGGSGTWSPTATTWLAGPSALTWEGRSEGVFASPGGVVVVAGTVGISQGLTVAGGGYVFRGGSLDLGGGGDMVPIEVANVAGAEIDSELRGARGLRKTGGGQLLLRRSIALGGPLWVAAGVLARPVDVATTLSVTALEVDEAAGGLLDIGAGRIEVGRLGILPSDLRADLLAGRNGGDWNGAAGIVSTAARGAEPGSRTIGYRINPDGSALVAFAAPGDANLDGRVDLQDLIQISTAGRFGSGLGADWGQGDVDYDGVFGLFDLVAIANSGVYGSGPYLPPSDAGGARLVAVPEPATLGLAAALGILGLRRLGRRHGSGRLIP